MSLEEAVEYAVGRRDETEPEGHRFRAMKTMKSSSLVASASL